MRRADKSGEEQVEEQSWTSSLSMHRSVCLTGFAVAILLDLVLDLCLWTSLSVQIEAKRVYVLRGLYVSCS